MKKITITLTAVALVAVTFTASKTANFKQPATANTQITDYESSLYTRLGGMRGIRIMVDKYVELAAVNPVDGQLLLTADISLLKMDMVNEIVAISGGPYKANRTYASRLRATPLSQTFALAMQQCNIAQQEQYELVNKLDNQYMVAQK